MGEITVILLLALIVLGPKKLPELASGLGKIIKDIRKATNDVKNEIQLDEHIRKPFEELRDAVTLPPEELKRRDQLKKDLEQARKKAEADLAALSNAEAAAVAGPGDPEGTLGAASAGAGALPLPGMPAAVPPPFPAGGLAGGLAGGSGPHGASTVPPPFPGAGSGPHGASSIPPPVPPGVGSGPHGSALPPPVHHPVHPPHTVPVGANRDGTTAKGLPTATRTPRPPGVAPSAVPAPKPHGEKTVTTQFLSEADLIPPDVPPPLPPQVPGSTGKHTHPPPTPHDDGAGDTKKEDKKDDVS